MTSRLPPMTAFDILKVGDRVCYAHGACGPENPSARYRGTVTMVESFGDDPWVQWTRDDLDGRPIASGYDPMSLLAKTNSCRAIDS